MNIYIGSSLFLASGLFHMSLCRYLQGSLRKPVIRSISSTKLQFSQASCETCEVKPTTLRSLKDTVKSYKRHIVVCLGETQASWPKSIEKITDSFASRLNEALSERKNKEFPIRLTGCTYTPQSAMTNAVLVYPEGLIVSVPDIDIESFADIVSSTNTISSKDLNRFLHQQVSWKKLILCCVHGNRDKRCGEKGVEVVSAIKQELSHRNFPESEIAIHGSSHIGGHEFAGTLITYPSAHWYGYLTKDKVPELIDSIMNDRIMDDCYRGTGCSQLQW